MADVKRVVLQQCVHQSPGAINVALSFELLAQLENRTFKILRVIVPGVGQGEAVTEPYIEFEEIK